MTSHKLMTHLVSVIFLLWLFDSGVSSAVLRRISRDTQMYTTKYDTVDVDGILASNRLLKNHVNCLLEKGPCTNEGKELKKYLPDAIATECSKCSETQKKIAGKVFSHLLLNHRDDWNQLTAKYDPDGKFQAKYTIEDVDYSYFEDA